MTVDVTDEAWLTLVEIVEDTEVGDEIHATDRRFYEALGGDMEAESKALAVLDEATKLGFIEQVDDRAWTRRETQSQ